MSRFFTVEGDNYIEEIESMGICKWRINEVCCNGDCDCVADYPHYGKCRSKEDCKWFEEENGVIA